MDKRTFIKQLSLIGFGVPLSFSRLDEILNNARHLTGREVATNEDFWEEIRKEYAIKTDYINLENGYYCIQPQPTLEHFVNHVKEVNLQGSWYMRTVQWEKKKESAGRLAEMAGCSPNELIITRNTTESLDMIIAGQNWNAGDEAVMAEQDYGAMLNQFQMMGKRYGINNKILSLPNHPSSDEEIVDLYASAITDKTKLLMVCHMVNITGQILPIRKICDMAHERGVDVMVDGAHAFAHFEFSISDLNCDYYGTSLHKWLSVPLGAGFLYVKEGKAPNIWPLMSEDPLDDNDIYRLNHTGTHPVHTDLAIINAIEYHNKIGGERKEERLRYLQQYWTSKVRNLPKVLVNTPANPQRHCAIGNVGIEGYEPVDLAKLLLEKYKIWTVAIDRPGVRGLRITPNVFTTLAELDTFVDAIKEISS